jgi:hypothetical protein
MCTAVTRTVQTSLHASWRGLAPTRTLGPWTCWTLLTLIVSSPLCSPNHKLMIFLAFLCRTTTLLLLMLSRAGQGRSNKWRNRQQTCMATCHRVMTWQAGNIYTVLVCMIFPDLYFNTSTKCVLASREVYCTVPALPPPCTHRVHQCTFSNGAIVQTENRRVVVLTT